MLLGLIAEQSTQHTMFTVKQLLLHAYCLKQSVKQLFQRVVKKSINNVKQSLEYTEKGQNRPYMSRYCKHS